jgi:hypothetical protein
VYEKFPGMCQYFVIFNCVTVHQQDSDVIKEYMQWPMQLNLVQWHSRHDAEWDYISTELSIGAS